MDRQTENAMNKIRFNGWDLFMVVAIGTAAALAFAFLPLYLKYEYTKSNAQLWKEEYQFTKRGAPRHFRVLLDCKPEPFGQLCESEGNCKDEFIARCKGGVD